MQSSSRLNLIRQWTFWVIIQRWLAGAGLIATLAASQFWLRFPLDYRILWSLGAFLLLYNLLCYLFAHGKAGCTYLSDRPERFLPFAFIQIYLDLILLTLVLHFWGGAENPFIFFYVFHVAISSILFTRRTAALNALLAALCLNLLLLGEYSGVLAHYPLAGMSPAGLHRRALYLGCLGASLSFALLVVAHMVSFLVEQLRQREAEVQELHREKSAFMRKAAHELRAPLSAIQSCLQVVLEYFGKQLPDKARQLIERAEKRSGGLIEMVRDLLNLARAEEIVRNSKFAPLDLREVLESVVELLGPGARRRQIRIRTQLPPQPVPFKGDKGGLEEVFTNLLSNAVKYSPPASTVQVQMQVLPGEVEVSFADQGIGIPPEDMQFLFSEFFRSQNAKQMQVEGTGLGLALSSKIVRLHGGDIRVQSELNQGSCFTVRLPLPAQPLPQQE